MLCRHQAIRVPLDSSTQQVYCGQVDNFRLRSNVMGTACLARFRCLLHVAEVYHLTFSTVRQVDVILQAFRGSNYDATLAPVRHPCALEMRTDSDHSTLDLVFLEVIMGNADWYLARTQPLQSANATASARPGQYTKKPHKNLTCGHCGQPHMNKDCPTATLADKTAFFNTFLRGKKGKRKPVLPSTTACTSTTPTSKAPSFANAPKPG
jgi:hypothetical protein